MRILKAIGPLLLVAVLWIPLLQLQAAIQTLWPG